MQENGQETETDEKWGKMMEKKGKNVSIFSFIAENFMYCCCIIPANILPQVWEGQMVF